jgi:hypothetical protein
MPVDVLPKIRLGLYNGGWIAADDARRRRRRDQRIPQPRDAHRGALEGPRRAHSGHRTTHPYQVSVRFREGLATDACGS